MVLNILCILNCLSCDLDYYIHENNASLQKLKKKKRVFLYQYQATKKKIHLHILFVL